MSFTKKVIRSSSLALRFYAKDGWTVEELLEIAPDGFPYMAHPGDQEPYFIFTNDSKVKAELVYERCSELIRAYNDKPTQSDLDFIREYL